MRSLQFFMTSPRALLPLGGESARRLDPRLLIRNPVMFLLGAGTIICAWFTVAAVAAGLPFGVDLAITLILLLTVLLANAAQVLAGAADKPRASRRRTARDAFAARRRGRIIVRVERARHRTTPVEPFITILLCAMAAMLVAVALALVWPAGLAGGDTAASVTALLLCLLPTATNGVLSAINIAGKDRAICSNLSARSGAAVVAAGHVDTLLLDKSSIVTADNREATDFYPVLGVTVEALRDAALLASLAGPKPERAATIRLALDRGADDDVGYRDVQFIPFSSATGLCGIDVGRRRVRTGTASAVRAFVEAQGGSYPGEADRIASRVAGNGETARVVANGTRVLGVIALSNSFRTGVRERIARLSGADVRTIMMTGDAPLTAAAMARRAGVDAYVAEATPEGWLQRIRAEQAQGHRVAMMGKSSQDAPALVQADVGLAMSAGSPAAREAAAVIDLESGPNQLFELINIGRRLRLKRDVLAMFALACDVAKYFVIIPAALAASIPALGAFDVLHTGHPTRAVLAALIFNALMIPALIAMAVRREHDTTASKPGLLRTNMWVYAVGGVLLPFAAIKLIDLLLSAFPAPF